jgi:hypothetical protein
MSRGREGLWASRHTNIRESTELTCHGPGDVCGGGARSPLAVFLRCSRIFLMRRGSVMKATRRRVPPQGHKSGSSPDKLINLCTNRWSFKPELD